MGNGKGGGFLHPGREVLTQPRGGVGEGGGGSKQSAEKYRLWGFITGPYRDTEIQRYRDTEIQRYRDTGLGEREISLEDKLPAKRN